MMTLKAKKTANANTIACMTEALKLAEAKLETFEKDVRAQIAVVDAMKADAAAKPEDLEAAITKLGEMRKALRATEGYDEAVVRAVYRRKDLAKQQAFIIRKAVR